MCCRATEREAARIRNEYGVDARRIGTHLEGMHCPILVDKYTVEEMIYTLLEEMRVMSKRIEAQNKKLDSIRELLY